MRHWIRSAFFQIMAFRLSKPMLSYCQSGHWNINKNTKNFIHENASLKNLLRNGGHFVQGVMGWFSDVSGSISVSMNCVNIGSSFGLLPAIAKPLPEPILTFCQRGPVIVTWGWFHRYCLIVNVCLKITYSKSQPHPPSANESTDFGK